MIFTKIQWHCINKCRSKLHSFETIHKTCLPRHHLMGMIVWATLKPVVLWSRCPIKVVASNQELNNFELRNCRGRHLFDKCWKRSYQHVRSIAAYQLSKGLVPFCMKHLQDFRKSYCTHQQKFLITKYLSLVVLRTALDMNSFYWGYPFHLIDLPQKPIIAI